MRGRAIKRSFFGIGILLSLVVALAGCGGGGSGTSTLVVQTLSDLRADGDIGFTPPPPAGGTFLISRAAATGNVVFGIDSDSASLPEFRAFLDFPLDGSNGGGVLPPGVAIASADIEVFVQRVSFGATVPTSLEVVPFGIPLVAADFDSPSLTPTSFRTLNFFSADEGGFVRIDVTRLMEEVQRQGLRNLQVRFELDPVVTAGLVVIADAGAGRAPLLTVEFLP